MYENLTDEQIEELYLEFMPDCSDNLSGSLLSESWNEEDFTRDDVISYEELEETRNLHKTRRREFVEKQLEKLHGSKV